MGLSRRLENAGSVRHRVLIVDDEPGTVDLLKMYFEMFNFEVTTAYSGLEALDQIDTKPFDAMILDLMLPDIDGLLVCRKVRDAARTASLPVLMLSARSSKEDVQKGYQAGATLYFKKPVDLNKLLAEVRRIIDAGGHIVPSAAQQESDADAPATGISASQVAPTGPPPAPVN